MSGRTRRASLHTAQHSTCLLAYMPTVNRKMSGRTSRASLHAYSVSHAKTGGVCGECRDVRPVRPPKPPCTCLHFSKSFQSCYLQFLTNGFLISPILPRNMGDIIVQYGSFCGLIWAILKTDIQPIDSQRDVNRNAGPPIMPCNSIDRGMQTFRYEIAIPPTYTSKHNCFRFKTS